MDIQTPSSPAFGNKVIKDFLFAPDFLNLNHGLRSS
jgi:hypothetical protein